MSSVYLIQHILLVSTPRINIFPKRYFVKYTRKNLTALNSNSYMVVMALTEMIKQVFITLRGRGLCFITVEAKRK